MTLDVEHRFSALVAAVAAAAAIAAILLRPAPAPAPDPVPVEAERAAVEKERAADQAAYAKFEAEAGRGRNSGWVVIAGGKVADGGATLDEASKVAADAKHRFVFAIGPEPHDDEQFVSQWYGPRFAGMAILQALKIGATIGVEYEKDGKKVPVKGVRPFPRSQVSVGAPGGPSEILEVFIGTVGPPLMLTPDDWDRLGLARWEVPGKHTVWGLPCHRARVRVSIPGLDGDAELIASCPAFEREKLIEFARYRDMFWQHDWIAKDVVKGREGKWILYGVDRVLGEDVTAAGALNAGEEQAPEAYHRYLIRVPREGPDEWVRGFFGKETKTTLNGQEVLVRPFHPAGSSPTSSVVLASAAVAKVLRLELADEGRDVVLKDADGKNARPARAGWAWNGSGRLGVRRPDDGAEWPTITKVLYEEE